MTSLSPVPEATLIQAWPGVKGPSLPWTTGRSWQEVSEAEGWDTQGEAKEPFKMRMSQIQDGEPWESQMGKPTLLGKEQALEEREKIVLKGQAFPLTL